MENRQGMFMAGMILISAAEHGNDADVELAMDAIDPVSFALLAKKFGDRAARAAEECIICDNTMPSVPSLPPFIEFAASCFLHDVDPKYCTCYKHRGNISGRAECNEVGCPLYRQAGPNK
jgi:hypothetical protein